MEREQRVDMQYARVYGWFGWSWDKRLVAMIYEAWEDSYRMPKIYDFFNIIMHEL